MRTFTFLLLCSLSFRTAAQETATTLTFSGYAELYYGYDFSRPDQHQRAEFLYNHTRHHEVNLNLGYLKASLLGPRTRAHLALMAGTYAQDNLAAEPPLLQSVFEANAGILLGGQWWLDAGILPSHIGFESAIGRDCQTLSRSLAAENSPYYESGVRLSNTWDGERWYAAALLLNGWQRIRRTPGNQRPAFGTQLTYRPRTDAMLNWSSYVGSEGPDSTGQWRCFQNFYGQYPLGGRWSLLAGFDVGVQQGEGRAWRHWWTPVAIVQYRLREQWQFAWRGEYYSDPDGVVITSRAREGFRTAGFSFNADYHAGSRWMCRVEARYLHAREPIFLSKSGAKNGNLSLLSAICVSF